MIKHWALQPKKSYRSVSYNSATYQIWFRLPNMNVPEKPRMQLKSFTVTSNAYNRQWLLASKFSIRCSAQCFI